MAKKSGHGGARKGAGRPAVFDDSVDVSFRAPRDLVDRVDAHCERVGCSRAVAIRLALKHQYGSRDKCAQ